MQLLPLEAITQDSADDMFLKQLFESCQRQARQAKLCSQEDFHLKSKIVFSRRFSFESPQSPLLLFQSHGQLSHTDESAMNQLQTLQCAAQKHKEPT